MRATNYKHYGSESKTTSDVSVKKSKSRKSFKAASLALVISLSAAALIVPTTTTLAPDVNAYEDSRVASYSVGDIDKFSAVITNNCVEVTTTPVVIEPATEAAKKTAKKTTAAKKTDTDKTTESSNTETKSETSKTEKTESSQSSASKSSQQSSEGKSGSFSVDESSDTYSYSNSSASYSGSALVSIANPDPSYAPSHVSLSAYDRAKTERLVMGEGGLMGYEGCALIAQSIRDAMNRSGTSSIDQIISEYQYFGSTAYEPNQDVKDAVSFIFDQDGVAVQHRVMCFYVGSSAWHETQTFLCQIGSVRFFDLVAP